jgi:hypothetical protein
MFFKTNFSLTCSYHSHRSHQFSSQSTQTVGYGDLDIKHSSTRKFSIFFIFYCVLVFATAIQNIIDSYGEVKHHRGRIARALVKRIGFRRASTTSLADQEQVMAHQIDSITGTDEENEGGVIVEGSYIERYIKTGNLHMQNGSSSPVSAKEQERLDCNEFVIEALVSTGVVDHSRDLEPIIQFLRGLVIGADGMIDRAELLRYREQFSSNTIRSASTGSRMGLGRRTSADIHRAREARGARGDTHDRSKGMTALLNGQGVVGGGNSNSNSTGANTSNSASASASAGKGNVAIAQSGSSSSSSSSNSTNAKQLYTASATESPARNISVNTSEGRGARVAPPPPPTQKQRIQDSESDELFSDTYTL